MAKLHHAQAFGLESSWGHDPMPAHGDQAVAEPLQHDAGVEDHLALGR